MPTYTPRTVSKSDPMVSNVTVPDEGAVQLYQTEPVDEVSAEGFGSDACIVAPTLLPDMEPEVPEIVTADKKSSLLGAGDTESHLAYSVVTEDETVVEEYTRFVSAESEYQPPKAQPLLVGSGKVP